MRPKECRHLFERLQPRDAFSSLHQLCFGAPSTQRRLALVGRPRMRCEQIYSAQQALVLTMRMYSSITGRRGKPSVRLADRRRRRSHPALVAVQLAAASQCPPPAARPSARHAQEDAPVRVQAEVVDSSFSAASRARALSSRIAPSIVFSASTLAGSPRRRPSWGSWPYLSSLGRSRADNAVKIPVQSWKTRRKSSCQAACQIPLMDGCNRDDILDCKCRGDGHNRGLES